MLGKYGPARLRPRPFPILVVLGMELMAVHMVGRHLTIELHLKPLLTFYFDTQFY